MSQGAPRKATSQEIYLQLQNNLGNVAGQIANIRAGIEVPFRMGILQNPERYAQALDKLYDDALVLLALFAEESGQSEPEQPQNHVLLKPPPRIEHHHR